MSEKKYNKSLVSLWKQGSGNFMSMKVDGYTLDQLKTVKEGGKVMIRFLTEEQRSKFKDKDKAPHAFIDFLTPESVAEYESKRQTKTEETGGGL